MCGQYTISWSCGGKEAGSEQRNIEPIEQSDGQVGNVFVEGTETPEAEETGVPDSTDTGNADEADTENVQAMYAAQVRHYYGGILSQITAAWRLQMESWTRPLWKTGLGR